MPGYSSVQYGKFVQAVAGTAFSTVYTTPSGDQAVLQDLVLDNGTAAPVTVTICVVPQGAVAGAANAIIWQETIPANSFVEWSGSQVLNAAETVQISASVANAITVTGSGIVFQLVAGSAPGTGTPPSGGAPPSGNYDVTVQAENMDNAATVGVLTGPLTDWTGTGYTDWSTTAGVTLTAHFTNVPAGTYNVKVRYYNYNTAQQNTIKVDGVSHTGIMFTAGANVWNTLADASVQGITLAAGDHTVSLVSEWGYTYFDWVELQQTAAAPAPSPTPGGGSGYNFGSRLDGAYPYGIKPTATNATLDGYVKAMYDKWKAARLVAAPNFTPTLGIFAGIPQTGMYYVYTAQQSGKIATVSEAIGYGMLIMVIMAGYDVNAQSYFDGMYKLARSRPAYSMTTNSNANLYMMDWELNNDATLSSAGGGYGANDGDQDIALALLMAHRQWGSTGAIDYHAQAINTINACKASSYQLGTPFTGLPYVPPGGAGHDCSRTSDYMLGHFTAFKAATGDTFWDSARTSCISLLQQIDTNYEGTVHLPPDWIQHPVSGIAYPTAGCPRPSPGNIIEGPYEGDFAQNAIRVPWRLGTDFIYSNDANVHTLVSNIVAKIKGIAAGNAAATSWAYDLTGTALTGTNLYYEPTTDGCQLAGAMVDTTHQAWLDALITQISGNFNTNYYAAELCLLGMIVASGNWWRP